MRMHNTALRYWRELCTEACRDRDNLDRLASLFLERLTPDQKNMDLRISGGTELGALTENGRFFGQVFSSKGR
jgi:hypothetical protein